MDGGEQFEMAVRLVGLRGRQQVVQSGVRSEEAVITWSQRVNLTAYWCFFIIIIIVIISERHIKSNILSSSLGIGT